jgi:hypothetical protein
MSSQDNSVGIKTGPRTGFCFLAMARNFSFSHNVQTGSGVQLAFCTMGTWVFHVGGGGVMNGGAILSLPYISSWHLTQRRMGNYILCM